MSLKNVFGMPVGVDAKHQLPSGTFLVRLEPSARGLIADINGWCPAATIRAEGGWPEMRKLLDKLPDAPLPETTARIICASYGIIYNWHEHKKHA